jgi:hypothetical protein
MNGEERPAGAPRRHLYPVADTVAEAVDDRNPAAHYRAVARAGGMSWIGDLAPDELARLRNEAA